MCVFNGGFMHLRPDFSRFGHDLLLEKILPNAGQNCFQTVTFPPLFFLQHVSLALSHL